MGQGNIFTPVCHSVHGGHAWLRGVCMVVAGHAWLWGVCMVVGVCVVARGHVWLLGGMRGWWGACMVVGVCVWLWEVCMVVGACVVVGGGGMRGWWGACMIVGGTCIEHDEIRSMSRRYASYWNAFLFISSFVIFHNE